MIKELLKKISNFVNFSLSLSILKRLYSFIKAKDVLKIKQELLLRDGESKYNNLISENFHITSSKSQSKYIFTKKKVNSFSVKNIQEIGEMYRYMQVKKTKTANVKILQIKAELEKSDKKIHR